jgi:hypothetical protein
MMMSALMGGGALRAAGLLAEEDLVRCGDVRERLALIVGDENLRRYIL